MYIIMYCVFKLVVQLRTRGNRIECPIAILLTTACSVSIDLICTIGNTIALQWSHYNMTLLYIGMYV